MTTIDSRFSARILDALAKPGLPVILDVKAPTATTPAEILLYDEIGQYGTTAKAFNAALAKAGDGPLTLRINSPGGDVFDGLAIHNSLKSRKAPVNVVVDGLAASAASVIAMAGTSLAMHQASQIMLHNSWALAMGDRHVMDQMSSTLAKVDGQLAGIYAAKSGQPVEDVATVLDNETWLTADEAHEQGYCDSVIVPEPAPKAVVEVGNIQAQAEPTETLGQVIDYIVAAFEARDQNKDKTSGQVIDEIAAAFEARDQKELRLRRLRVRGY